MLPFEGMSWFGIVVGMLMYGSPILIIVCFWRALVGWQNHSEPSIEAFQDVVVIRTGQLQSLAQDQQCAGWSPEHDLVTRVVEPDVSALMITGRRLLIEEG